MKRSLKITLFRMWAAGAVCFFAAWGLSGVDDGSMKTVGMAFSFNLIAGLIAIMVICDIFIVNPVIRLAGGRRAFNIEEKRSYMFLIGGFLHVIKITALILLIVQTYYFLNIFFIRILNLDEKSVPVPLEPILFGILYGLFYLFFDIVWKFITGRRRLGVAETFDKNAAHAAYLEVKHEESIYQQSNSADERGSENWGAPDSGLYRNDDPSAHP